MLTDFEITILTEGLESIKHNKRRFAKLDTIWQGNLRVCKQTVDDFSDAAAMCVETPDLMKAVMPVSKSPVWASVSRFLREERHKQVKKFDPLRRARSKAFAKARRTGKSRAHVAGMLAADSVIVRAALNGQLQVPAGGEPENDAV
jgi:hypothetical protein